METTVHLVSMPFCDAFVPSIQLGCLKAYLDRQLGGAVPVWAHSAYFDIQVLERDSALDPVRRNVAFDKIDNLEAMSLVTTEGKVGLVNRHHYGEGPYFVLYARRYLRAALGDAYDESQPFGGLLDFDRGNPLIKKWFDQSLGQGGLELLAERTHAYVERQIVPRLSPAGLNVVGFTCTFDQIYSSAYCLRYLRDRCPDAKFVFLFGGSSIGMPTTQAVLKRLELDAFCVIGEGERKLESLVRLCLAAEPAATWSADLRQAAASIPGVTHAGDEVDYFEKQHRLYEGQVEKLDVLPAPNYDEFFAGFRSRCEDEAAYQKHVHQVELLLEGSRGCVFTCTFCNLNYIWEGYRSQAAEQIIDNMLTVRGAYGDLRVRFVDNLCNWSPGFAKAAIERGISVPTFMELRAKYPEEYWVKLVKSGVWRVQVGFEAFSTELLELMDKKSLAIDNVRALKYISELGIEHQSNFIVRYPRSTLKMVEETRRVFEHIVHFTPVDASHFLLVAGSPLYEELSRESKAGLKPRMDVNFAARVADYSAHYAYDSPPELALPTEIDEAWRTVTRWYEATTKARPRPAFTVERVGAELRLVDTRAGEKVEYTLQGPAARVLDACHKGLNVNEIAKATGLAEGEIRESLVALEARKAVLLVDGRYVTVALRPRDEVMAKYAAPDRPLAAPAEVHRAAVATAG